MHTENRDNFWGVAGRTERLEPPFNILPDDSRLHAHEHVVPVDPLDRIHKVHVQADNHTLFALGALRANQSQPASPSPQPPGIPHLERAGH